MSPYSRLAATVLAGLLLAVGAGLAWLAEDMRQGLREQVSAANQEAAVGMLVHLSGAGDAGSAAGRLATAFEHGSAMAVELRPDGVEPPVAYRRPALQTRAPGWFTGIMPIAAMPGWARVPLGARRVATLQVVGQSSEAQDALWNFCMDALACWLGLALAALGCGWGLARRRRRILAPVVAQAQALAQGQLMETDETAQSELQPLVRGLNRAVGRLRELFATQAQQVAQLQRQAQLDAVTRLPMRSGFVGRLAELLDARGGPGAALLLLQVPELDGLNRRLGHDATDRLLGAVAELLQAYVDRVAGAFAGRLNGSDFALCLPVAGVAEETAGSLHAALGASPVLRAAGIEVLVAGVDGLRETTASAALAAADAALARAQADRCVAIDAHGDLVVAKAGSGAWREQIAAALAQGRARLEESPVADPTGARIHLECPLSVQLDEAGAFEASRQWLALARRSRLLPQVDLAGIDLALRACGNDGQARAVHVSEVSLAAPDFIAQVAQRLAAAPGAAARLAVECAQGTGADAAPLLAKAAASWRPLGVRVGVEHAGGSPQQLPGLQNAGIDFVKVDASHLRGVASDEALRGYVQGLVALIHGLGLAAFAQGIGDAQDLAVLWRLGFDGASGPVVPCPATA